MFANPYYNLLLHNLLHKVGVNFRLSFNVVAHQNLSHNSCLRCCSYAIFSLLILTGCIGRNISIERQNIEATQSQQGTATNTINAEDSIFQEKVNSFLLNSKVQTLEKKEALLKQSLGKVTILSFFATWCLECKGNISYLELIQNKFLSQGLKVILIGVEDKLPKLQDFKISSKTSLEVLHDKNNSFKSILNFYSLPLTLIIDSNSVLISPMTRDGSKINRIVGLIDWNNIDLAATLESHL